MPKLNANNVFTGSLNKFGPIDLAASENGQAMVVRSSPSSGGHALMRVVEGNTQGDMVAMSASGMSVYASGEAAQAFVDGIKNDNLPPALTTLNHGRVPLPTDEITVLVADGAIALGTGYDNGGQTGSWWGIDRSGWLTRYRSNGSVWGYLGTNVLDTGVDIHTVLIDGDYTLGEPPSIAKNWPDTANYGTLQVRTSPSGNVVTHQVITVDGNMYTEGSLDGGKTWSAWVKH